MPGFALADSEPVEETVKLDLTSAQLIVFEQPVKKEAPKVEIPPTIHEVQDGDTLYAIAEVHDIAWAKIYDANTEIENPDFIKPGDKLKIPKRDEEVVSRSLPAVQVIDTAVHVDAPAVTVAAVTVYQELSGSYGYVSSGSNCVNTAKAHGKNQPGDPINWAPTTHVPFIGAAALFNFNHVAIVSGIHADGSIEVIHENCPGCPTRYPRNAFRGFF